MGYIGLYEVTKLIKGVSHTTPEGEEFALRVMDVEAAEDDYQTALRGIEAMEAFFRSIDMPTSLTALGVSPTDAQITEMAEKCIQAVGGKTLGVVKPLTVQDVAAIYQAAK